MTKPVANIGRAVLTVCAAAAVLGQVGTASALSVDADDITAVRMERKRANSDGKLPLPGTPDLKRLDERRAEQRVVTDAPIVIRVFKAESEMEVWTGDENGRLLALCHLSDLLLVRHAGAEAERGRQAGARRLLHRHHGAELPHGNAVAEVAEYRLSEPVRSGEPALRLAHPHSRRMRLDRLLRDDERGRPRGA